ncbi:MAG: endonuclease/exonuclease/phosphatase family protein [Gammaproteobacteria bacterium]|nr:endonuclease/exonuclease/phosphatase family protein [Gammaproteobacteria bacterium]MDH3373274.1 endonuclease/exonuclease/phosphatase family protein [Gammaproteobacteria bacterium]MDH3409587.1 endonuclease/exonuclease/phosphatase family protein [Gammaproteobacteria bacterium]MDH3551783.1 endonuclease/exonuclease/phosphatase family protein [Gammaproteobacteria bacterium]
MRFVARRLSFVGLLQAAAVVTTLFSLATLPNSLHRHLELFSHFRLQYLLVSLLLCLSFIALRSRAWAGLMLVITAINTVPVAPWYLAETRTHAETDPRIELLLANVHSRNANTRALIELIETEQPDLVFLQEATDRWVVAMNVLQTRYPHRYSIARDDNFGIAVYARQPLLGVEKLDSPPYGFPSLVLRQSVAGRIVTLVTTHPIPPLGKDGFDARNEQLASIAEVITSIAGPRLLVGDLNTTMWGHHYDLLERATGLRNARHGIGIVPTWPRQLPFAMIPIDHCLVSEDFAVVDIDSGPSIGSDHLPLTVTLALVQR